MVQSVNGIVYCSGCNICLYLVHDLRDTCSGQQIPNRALYAAGMIARDLDLMRGGKRYIKTAAYGHFGRDDPDFTWEKVKKLEV